MAFIEKNLWLATNFAAKLIRETHWRNKSISKAAKYYGVSEKAIEDQLSERQSKGQKGKLKGKQSWFCLFGHVVHERRMPDYYDDNYATWDVVRATTEENAKKQMRKRNDYYHDSEHCGSYICGNIKRFDTEIESKVFIQTENEKILTERKLGK